MRLINVVRLETGKHKYRADFDDGTSTKFGASGYTDFTLSGDTKKRDLYRARHAKDLLTRDPKRAGHLAMFLLWGDSTSLAKNIASYKKRFNL